MATVGSWWNARLLVGAYDLSGYSNKIELAQSVPMLPVTVFGNQTTVNLAGIPEIGFNFAGFMPTTAAADLTDKILHDNVGGANVPVTIMPTNTPAVGDVAYFFNCQKSSIQYQGQHGQLYQFAANGVNGSLGYPLIRGVVLDPGTVARTTTGSGTATNVLGAITAAQYLYATLHVTALNTPTSIVVRVQSSADGSTSWTTRATFATITTTIGSQYLTRVAGPVTDTYWRVDYTITGTSYTFSCAAGKA